MTHRGTRLITGSCCRVLTAGADRGATLTARSPFAIVIHRDADADAWADWKCASYRPVSYPAPQGNATFGLCRYGRRTATLLPVPSGMVSNGFGAVGERPQSAERRSCSLPFMLSSTKAEGRRREGMMRMRLISSKTALRVTSLVCDHVVRGAKAYWVRFVHPDRQAFFALWISAISGVTAAERFPAAARAILSRYL